MNNLQIFENGEFGSIKCNFDCFNCVYDDCINDDMTYNDYQQSKLITRQVLRDRLDNKALQNKIRRRAYRQANKDKIKAFNQAYYQANRNKIKACQQAYYQANRNKIKAYKQAYYQAHKGVRKSKNEKEVNK